MRPVRKVFFALLTVVLILNTCEAKRKKSLRATILRQKETNAVNFIRLAAMRLIYGVATRIGFGEQISEALNGIFVPPGVDDYDYDQGGLGLFDRDDDDDYDY
ncbi:hypothetical protein NQ318_005800 [Aromia moschata]|uniref:Uncharacterized protein n=1 Tax=Aromia moschata TaxID=1265417 RepID=A0AAV8YU44_9CUCU|nr:hypothetical protein NQ318_005800 [Aromia moschata]